MFTESKFDLKAWRGGLTYQHTDQIHEKSLEVLSTIGFRLTDQESQSLCQEAGGMVNKAEGIVKLPPEVIEWALAECPSELTRYRLDGKPYVLNRNELYQCTGTHRTKYLDYGKETPRRATCEDLKKLVQVADALPGIISVSPAITPVDSLEGPTELTELEILLSNTGKHIYNSPATVREVRWTLDLLELLSEVPLIQKPTITIRAAPHTPLVLDDEVAQIIITSARRGAILALGSACAAGANSPVTLAGTILMQNAEFLFMLVLAQLAKSGCPVDYQVSSTIADLRTGSIMYGSIEMTLITAGLMAMADRYNIPFSANQSTDAPTIEINNGLQKMIHFAYKMAIGLNFLRNAGDLNKASTMSCEQMIIDHEIAQILKRFWQGIRVDDEALAVDVIREIGPGGMFLVHEHTLKHCRNGEHYIAPFLYRDEKGQPTLLQWAHKRVNEILSSHEYKLPEGKAEQLRIFLEEERKHTND